MLLDTFFKIVNTSQEEEKTMVQVELDKDHKIYEGHFPGNPVVPGVCLIQMIKEVIEVQQQQKLRLSTADEIKFLNIVNPLTANLLNIEIKKRPNAENQMAFSIIMTDGQITYLKMKAEFSREQ